MLLISWCLHFLNFRSSIIWAHPSWFVWIRSKKKTIIGGGWKYSKEKIWRIRNIEKDWSSKRGIIERTCKNTRNYRKTKNVYESTWKGYHWKVIEVRHNFSYVLYERRKNVTFCDFLILYELSWCVSSYFLQ